MRAVAQSGASAAKAGYNAAVAKRKGAVKGGEKRAQELTPDRRREIAVNAARVRWNKD